MKQQIIKYALAVILGVAIGVPIAVQNATKPAIIRQFASIIETQRSMDQRLAKIEKQQQFVFDVVNRAETGAQQAQMAQQKARAVVDDNNTVYSIPVDGSPFLGDKDGAVTIVEFADLQCPFCRRFHPAIHEVLKAYPKGVKYVMKHFPLSMHQQARPAAKAALAANEQGKYWEMVDLLLENGPTLSEDRFKEFAQKIGLNVDKFIKDYKEKDAEWEKIIMGDMALGSDVNVRGTPTFFLNGKKTMARDLDSWKAEIDAILKK